MVERALCFDFVRSFDITYLLLKGKGGFLGSSRSSCKETKEETSNSLPESLVVTLPEMQAPELPKVNYSQLENALGPDTNQAPRD